MTVDTYLKHKKNVEADVSMICQMKFIYHMNKGYDEIAIPSMKEVLHVSIYPLLESMGFDTDIYDGVEKIISATLLEDIVRLHQLTKNPLKCVHKNSKYGYLVVILDSDTWEWFSLSTRYKGWVDKIILHYSDRKEVKMCPW